MTGATSSGLAGGATTPYHYPVFVVTHHPRKTRGDGGRYDVPLVTDGIESALEQAKEAAGGKDVMLWGGGQIVQQYLAAGLLDELELHVVPVLLGDGARIFLTSWTRECGSSRSGPSKRPTSRTSSTGS